MKTEYSEQYRILGLRIGYYRRKAGMTQEAFAEACGKSLNFIAQVEAPSITRGVSLETLFKMSEVLKIAPSKLLEDD